MSLGIEILIYSIEYITQMICIYSVAKEKFKLDYKTLITFILFVGILITAVKVEDIKILSMIPHIILFFYVKNLFKLKAINSMIVIILNFLLSGTTQIIAAVTMSGLYGVLNDDHLFMLCINVASLVIMILGSKLLNLNELYNKAIHIDERIMKILAWVILIFMQLYIQYKIEETMMLGAYFVSTVMICIIVKIALDWNKDRYEIRQKELELHMHEVYGKTFYGMIEKIRIRQHDFKNQMAAIYGMHLTADNFEELVESQKKYCEYLMEESKFDSILTKCNDKILAGFLYTKFTEWEKRGVNFKFDIVLNDSQCKLPTYDLIKITGILIDNAAEEQLQQECNCDVEFYLRDSDDCVSIKSLNRTEYVSMDKIGQLFNKGYSTKGEGRGLGLYEVKRILEDKGEIVVRNVIENKINYVEFNIQVKK